MTTFHRLQCGPEGATAIKTAASDASNANLERQRWCAIFATKLKLKIKSQLKISCLTIAIDVSFACSANVFGQFVFHARADLAECFDFFSLWHFLEALGVWLKFSHAPKRSQWCVGVQGAHNSDCSVIHTVSFSMFCHVTKATCSDPSMLMATVLGQLSQIDIPCSRPYDPWSMRCPSKLILKTATQQIQAESYHHLHPPKSFDAEDTRPYQACGKLPWSL